MTQADSRGVHLKILLSTFIHIKVNRDHPFKTSACPRGEGCPHVPMFADARGGGVVGVLTSAIFEIIRRQISISN